MFKKKKRTLSEILKSNDMTKQVSVIVHKRIFFFQKYFCNFVQVICNLTTATLDTAVNKMLAMQLFVCIAKTFADCLAK